MLETVGEGVLEGFVDGMGWTVQVGWTTGEIPFERPIGLVSLSSHVELCVCVWPWHPTDFPKSPNPTALCHQNEYSDSHSVGSKPPKADRHHMT